MGVHGNGNTNSSKKPSSSKKRNTTRAASGSQKVEWKGYVNYSVTESQKASFKKWTSEAVDFDAVLSRVVESGYKVGVTYDERNAAFAGTLFCTDPHNDNAGWCLSMRASDAYVALWRVVFVHVFCLEEVWVGDEHSARFADW